MYKVATYWLYAGNLASSCHPRWQQKISVFSSVEGGLPPLPPLFLKSEKNRKYRTPKEFVESGGNGGNSLYLTQYPWRLHIN